MSTQSVPVASRPGADLTGSAKTKRYHPTLVALHWLIAILIFGTALLAQENEGGRERGEGRNFPQPGIQQSVSLAGFTPQAGSQNIFSRIGIHMIAGIGILVLLVIRLIV